MKHWETESRFGNWCLKAIFRSDNDGRNVKKTLELLNGKEVKNVTPKALEILEFLISKQGEIVRRQAILAAIWPEEHVTGGNIDVHIGELRRAFDDDPDPDKSTFIQTVRGRGLKFIPQLLPDHGLEPPPAPQGEVNLTIARPHGLTDEDAIVLYHVVKASTGLPANTPASVDKIVESCVSSSLATERIVETIDRLRTIKWDDEKSTYLSPCPAPDHKDGVLIEGAAYVTLPRTAAIIVYMSGPQTFDRGHEGQIRAQKLVEKFGSIMDEPAVAQTLTRLVERNYLFNYPASPTYLGVSRRTWFERKYIERIAQLVEHESSPQEGLPNTTAVAGIGEHSLGGVGRSGKAAGNDVSGSHEATAEVLGVLTVLKKHPCHRYHLTLDDQGKPVWIYTLIDFRKSDPGKRLLTSAPVLLKADATETDRDINMYDFDAHPYGSHLLIKSRRSDGTSDMCVDLYPHADTQYLPFCGARINDTWFHTTVASSVSILNVGSPLKEFEGVRFDDVREGPLDNQRSAKLRAMWEQRNEVVRLPADWPVSPHQYSPTETRSVAPAEGRDPRDLFKLDIPYYHYHLTLTKKREPIWIGKIIRFQADKHGSLFAHTPILPFRGAAPSDHLYEVTPTFLGQHLIIQLTRFGSDSDMTVQVFPYADSSQFPSLYCATINRTQTNTFVSSIAILSTEPLGGEIEGPVDEEHAAILLTAWEEHANKGSPEIVRLPLVRDGLPKDHIAREPMNAVMATLKGRVNTAEVI